MRDVLRKARRLLALIPLLHHMGGPHRWMFYGAAAITLLVALLDGAITAVAVPFISYVVGAASGAETSLASWFSGWIPELRSERGMVMAVILIGLGVIAREGISGLARTFTYYATAMIVTHIRVRITDKLLTATTSYLDKMPSGAPLQIVVNEVRKWQQASRAFISAGDSLFTCILLSIILFNISAKLLAIMLALGMIAVPLKYFYSLRVFRLSQANTAASLSFMDTLAETVRGVRQLKIQNRQDEFRERINQASNTAERILLGANAMVVNEPVLIHSFAVSAMLGVLYVGHVMKLASLAEMCAFFFVMYRLMPPLAAFSTQINSILAAEPAVAYLAQYYDRDPASDERTGGAVLTRRHIDAIEFKDVNLTYADGRQALRDVNLSVRRGECIAIVGESGAGKSSLLHALLGMYEPSGKVLIDGKDISEIDLRSLRERLRLVPQDIHLMRSRVDEFIAAGNSKMDRECISKAAQTARADEFIANLPRGFKTEIGTGGHIISGGERQRLALAQALAHNPPVLLLDEATSALDSITEKSVLSNLSKWWTDRIVILVTHRVTNLRQVDRIYTVKEGVIAEMGNWDALMSRDGEFARLVRSQENAA